MFSIRLFDPCRQLAVTGRFPLQQPSQIESVHGQAVLEFVDERLGRAAVLVSRPEMPGDALAVGYDEPPIGSLVVDLDLLEDTAAAVPLGRLVTKASEPLAGLAASLEALAQPLQGPVGPLLHELGAGKANEVLQVVPFAEPVQPRDGETSVGADDNLHIRPLVPQGLDDRHEQLGHAVGRIGVATSQPQAQQHSGGSFEDEVGQVHVLAVEAIEQGQLLLAVAGIVGGIPVEDESLGLLCTHSLEEHLDQQPVDLCDLAGGDGILEPADGRLAGQCLSVTVGDGLKDGIVSQAGVIVGVLVSGDEAEEPLADKRQQVVADLGGLSVVFEDVCHGGRVAEALVELADGQQAGVGADEPAVEIRDDVFTRVEVEGKLCGTNCHAKASLPSKVAGVEYPHSTRRWRPLLCADSQNL